MLHVVIHQVGGYAREDEPTPSIIGAYEDPETARRVALCAGPSTVLSVEVGHIPPGIRQAALALGVALPAVAP